MAPYLKNVKYKYLNIRDTFGLVHGRKQSIDNLRKAKTTEDQNVSNFTRYASNQKLKRGEMYKEEKVRVEKSNTRWKITEIQTRITIACI